MPTITDTETMSNYEVITNKLSEYGVCLHLISIFNNKYYYYNHRPHHHQNCRRGRHRQRCNYNNNNNTGTQL